MDAGLLDVLHERGDVRVLAVAERVDVDLDRALEEAVDEHATAALRGRARRRRARSRRACGGRRARRRGARAPGSRSPRRRRRRSAAIVGDAPGRDGHVEPLAERREALAVLGEVDRVVRRPEDPVARVLERAGELERRLAAELDDDAVRPLAVADLEHLLGPQRLEVEPVGGVVVGRDGLRVAVHHHRLVAERAERLRRVDAAVVELDALPDPVRARAEDDDARLLAVRTGLVLLAPGRVEVVRGRLDLGRAGVDAPVRRAGPPATSAPAAPSSSLVFHASARSASDQPSRLRLSQSSATRSVLVRVERKALVARSSSARNHGCTPSGRSSSVAHGVAAPASSSRERIAFRNASVNVRPIPIASPTDFICVPERLVGARELLEREARELDDDVVERRLEARRRRPRQVVRDLVERVADGELGGDLGDRVAGRLAGERGRAGDARVHLDHPQLAGARARARTGCWSRRSRRRPRG